MTWAVQLLKYRISFSPVTSASAQIQQGKYSVCKFYLKIVYNMADYGPLDYLDCEDRWRIR